MCASTRGLGAHGGWPGRCRAQWRRPCAALFMASALQVRRNFHMRCPTNIPYNSVYFSSCGCLAKRHWWRLQHRKFRRPDWAVQPPGDVLTCLLTQNAGGTHLHATRFTACNSIPAVRPQELPKGLQCSAGCSGRGPQADSLCNDKDCWEDASWGPCDA